MMLSLNRNPLAIPLPVYLQAGMTTYASLRAAWQLWKSGSLSWNPALKKEVEALKKRLPENASDTEAEAAIERLARQRLEHFLEGLKFYLETPAPPREIYPSPVLWQEGSTRLLDYGNVRVRDPKKPAVLFIPSLINKAYILDLLPDRSLLRYLGEQGFHPLLLDWSAPEKTEMGFSLEDYIVKRLEPAIERANVLLGRPVVLAGYCMGGLLAMASALRKPKLVNGLVLLATPWDFHADDTHRIFLAPGAVESLEALIQQMPLMRPESIHAVFYLMNPLAVHRKFERLYELSGEDESAVLLAREYWVNDGVPLTRAVARSCFVDWAAKNIFVNDVWKVGKTAVIPENIKTPTFIATPAYDQIVPPGCAQPLVDRIKTAKAVSCPSGHVGMIVGRKAEKTLWTPLANWLESL